MLDEVDIIKYGGVNAMLHVPTPPLHAVFAKNIFLEIKFLQIKFEIKFNFKFEIKFLLTKLPM